MKRCQICGTEIKRGKNRTHHPVCIKRMFGKKWLPELSVQADDIPVNYREDADKFSIASIQPKIPMRINRKTKILERGKPGDDFILKPETTTFPGLPQIEKICMTAASVMGIPTPPHCLMTSGGTNTAFVVRHRQALQEPPVTFKTIREILGHEKKYTGDLTDIGLKIKALSEFPGLDVQLFFETALFAFIVGHSDLNLESFAIQIDNEGCKRLAPVWDIVSAKFYMPETDDFAMPMNGKINGIIGKDFMSFSQYLKIHEKAYARLFLRFYKGKRIIGRLIKESALSTEEKIKFSDVVNSRFKRLFS